MIAWLIMIVGWVFLWNAPRLSILNWFALVLAFVLLLPMALLMTLQPAFFADALKWWVLYMATFLAVGIGIILQRRPQVEVSTDAEFPIARFDLSRASREATVYVTKMILPIAAIGALIISVVMLLQGRGVESLAAGGIMFALLAAPLYLPIAMLWLIAKIIEFMRRD